MIGAARACVGGCAHSCGFGDEFWFEAEAFLGDVESCGGLSVECFEAAFDVGEVEVGEHVGERGERAVDDGVPVVEDAVCSTDES